jgi:phenylacetate-coenzyme A ligase PaaK-like adenylate-forming protein
MFLHSVWYYLESLKTWRTPEREMSVTRGKRVRELLRFSYRNIPYYRRSLATVGYDPGKELSLDRMPSLPMTSGPIVQENYSGLSPSNPGRVIVMRTSGTTGKPTQVLWSYEFADRRFALSVRKERLAGIGPSWTSARFKGAVPERQGPVPSRLEGARRALIEPVNRPYAFGYRSVAVPIYRDNFPRTIRELKSLDPDIINIRPSLGRSIVRAMEEAGITLHPKLVYSMLEVLTDRDRRRMESKFGAPVKQAYGVNELAGLAVECRKERYYHLYSDNFHFEVVRGGEQVSEGEWGELVATSLYNYSMPLIRYNTGDLVQVADEQGLCECGATLLRLRSILGRKVDSLTTAVGEIIPQKHVLDALESSTGLSDYQIRQSANSEILLRASPADIAKGRAELASAEIKRMLGDVDVEVESWDREEELRKFRPTLRSMETRRRREGWAKFNPTVPEASN